MLVISESNGFVLKSVNVVIVIRDPTPSFILELYWQMSFKYFNGGVYLIKNLEGLETLKFYRGGKTRGKRHYMVHPIVTYFY